MLAVTLLCVVGTSRAQEVQSAADTIRNFKLKVVDRKEKPYQGIVVQLTRADNAYLTDDWGELAFPEVTDRDSLIIYLPGGRSAVMSLDGLDSALVQLKKHRAYAGNNSQDRMIGIGYGSVNERNRTTPSSTIDVQELMKTQNFTSLYDLLQGRVAGLSISTTGGNTYSATIRGQKTFYGSNEPLVVIDGIPVGDLSTANGMINVRDIKTIDVLKEGSIYGSRGANGVILITTK
jgi:iron complex outermembrane receptor protein